MDARFTLIESRHKRSSFLNVVALELELPNVEILSQRAEPSSLASKFDLALARAFGAPAQVYALAAQAPLA